MALSHLLQSFWASGKVESDDKVHSSSLYLYTHVVRVAISMRVSPKVFVSFEDSLMIFLVVV